MVNVVLFDIGGVLVNSTVNVVSKVFTDEFGLTDEQIDAIWDNYIDSRLGCGVIDEEQFWQELCKEYRLRPVLASENLLGKRYSEVIEPDKEMMAIVRRLKDQGLRLAVLSDTIPPHAKVIKDLGIFEMFDPVFLSFEIGKRKPDAEAFQYVISKLGVDPTQIAFIDDFCLKMSIRPNL